MTDVKESGDEELFARFQLTPELQWEMMKRVRKLLNARKQNSTLRNFAVWITIAIIFSVVFNFIKHSQLVLLVNGNEMPSIAAWAVCLAPTLFLILLGIYSVFFARKNYRRNLEKYVTSKNVEYSFDAQGIKFLTEFSSGQWRYAAVDQVDEVDGSLMIRIGALMYFIPAEAYISLAAKERFLSELKSSLPTNKLNLTNSIGQVTAV
jgi:uncharacterized Tic20 family protein